VASIFLRLPAGVGITCFQLPQHGCAESLSGDSAETELCKNMVVRIDSFLYTLLFFFLAGIFLLGCSSIDNNDSSSGSEPLVKRTYYPDSITLKIEMTFKDDTTPHGHGRSFYPSGQLERIMNFIDGKKDGEEIDYYQNGIIKKRGYYKFGKADSIWTWYDSSGSKSKKSSVFNGEYVGEQVEYYQNGNVKKCSFYYPLNQITYELNYQEDGKIIDEFNEVFPLLIILTDNKSKVFKAGEEFRAMSFGCPCADNGGLREITLESPSQKWIIEKVSLADSVSRFMYRRMLTDTGRFELKVSCWNSSVSSYSFIVSKSESINEVKKKSSKQSD
jgi:hypothetical protein